MSDETRTTERLTTSSADYSASYYAAHLGSTEDYSWDTASWRDFFLKVAERIVAVTGAETVLDVGCAKGLLVQALAVEGVDAVGFDISEHAIESAHKNVRGRLSVASATDPIAGRFDLITCVEVLEHMAPTDAEQALDRMCAATQRILFSSGPADFAEPTHINVQPPPAWAALFAERGFFRRTDVDTSFLTPWTVLFERADVTVRDVVLRYEAQLAPLLSEVVEKRSALLSAYRQANDGGAGGASPSDVERWEAEVLEARHQLLTMRDHSLGTEAEVGRLNRDLAIALSQLQKAKNRVRALGERRDDLKTKLERTRRRLAGSQRLAAQLQGRLRAQESDLEQARRSFANRVARRLRGRAQ
jgi:SAM-dependent methyltransferase